jgi:probable rRNA maturation factor
MILSRQRGVRVRLAPLEAFLRRVREALHLERRELTVALVSNADIARLNRRYRGRRGPTDVLSFPAREGRRKGRPSSNSFASPDSSYLGDVAIAPGVARRNARVRGRSLEEELRVLVLHGVLHLLGHDHEADAGRMDRLERRLRRRLGLD